MSYVLEGATLTVSGDLNEALDVNFDIQLTKLLEQDVDVLTIDLLAVRQISSLYLGSLTLAAEEAATRDKRLRVIATSDVAKICQMVGLQHVLDLETK